VPEGTNRWQDVACCAEHAMQYFKEIAISRGELVEEESVVETAKDEDVVVEELSDEVLDELEDEDETDSEYDF
jgi:hypothetical protein